MIKRILNIFLIICIILNVFSFTIFAEMHFLVPQPSFNNTSNKQIINYAKQFIGYKYKYGGSSPITGFDCSGFTYYIMKQCGYNISRTCEGQKKDGTYVKFNNLQPGDLVLFERTYSASGCTHVGIYIGNNQFIHAANKKQGVIISSLLDNYYLSRFVCGRRICVSRERPFPRRTIRQQFFWVN